MVIVFVSSDRDQASFDEWIMPEASFDEYYSSMSFQALPYEKRDVKDSLASRFNVRGIPMRVVLRPNGDVVAENGRAHLQSLGNLAACLKKWGL